MSHSKSHVDIIYKGHYFIFVQLAISLFLMLFLKDSQSHG